MSLKLDFFFKSDENSRRSSFGLLHVDCVGIQKPVGEIIRADGEKRELKITMKRTLLEYRLIKRVYQLPANFYRRSCKENTVSETEIYHIDCPHPPQASNRHKQAFSLGSIAIKSANRKTLRQHFLMAEIEISGGKNYDT